MGDRTLLMLVVLLLPAYFTLLHEWGRPVPWGPGVDKGMWSITLSAVSLCSLLFISWPSIKMWEGNLEPMNWSELPDGLWRLFLFSLWLGISMRMLIMARADGILSSQSDIDSRSVVLCLGNLGLRCTRDVPECLLHE